MYGSHSISKQAEIKTSVLLTKSLVTEGTKQKGGGGGDPDNTYCI
jgi:hypothetical protein